MALKILKWIGISIGILLILGVLFLTWFGLETSGTFMRMREQPKLMTELKEMYGDKSLYVEKYESNSDGIFSVGSFDYLIKSNDNGSIKFEVEYEPSYGIPIGDSDEIIEGMEIIKMIYKSSKESAEKLFSIQDSLADERVIVYPKIVDIDDIEYSYSITEEYDYGATDCYVYNIIIDNNIDIVYITNKIIDKLSEQGIKAYQIEMIYADTDQFERYMNYLSTPIQIKHRQFFLTRKDNASDNNFYNFDNGIITSYERYTLVKKAGHNYVEVDGDRFDLESFLDNSYKNYYSNTSSVINYEKVDKTFEEKTNSLNHRVIETELNYYFDDDFTFYSNPFHIDENTVGDLEYRLFGNNPASRFQVVMERYYENGDGVLSLRYDYAVNFALAEANRKIDELILKEKSDIVILPDYISGCIETDDYENDLVNKEYLSNPIDYQNKYGTSNSVGRWLYPENYDKKQAISETVKILEKLGLNRYGVELVFVTEENKEQLIEEYNNLEIDESLYFSIGQDGNILYLTKDMDNIVISYEDVLLDKVIKKEYKEFIDK